MIGPSGWERVGLFREVRGEQGASKGEVQDTGAPNE